MRGAVRLIVTGMAIATLSLAGMLSLANVPEDSGVPHPTRVIVMITLTPLQEALVRRQALALTTPLASITPTATGTPPPPPEIKWTEAEKNALSWLCWYEVRGFAENKIDACLSVISTIRARYAYNSGFGETDVIGTLLRPGQFTGVNFDTSRPAPDPDLYRIVEMYQAGARGSCNGFLYYDSVPGGPSLCVIRSSTGQWEEFHNGWN